MCTGGVRAASLREAIVRGASIWDSSCRLFTNSFWTRLRLCGTRITPHISGNRHNITLDKTYNAISGQNNKLSKDQTNDLWIASIDPNTTSWNNKDTHSPYLKFDSCQETWVYNYYRNLTVKNFSIVFKYTMIKHF